jgi:putative NADH-flavin reductase
VIVVAIPGREIDGRKLLDSLKPLTDAAARAGTRLGFVGGAGSLQVTEGGPRLVDTPEFPEAHKNEALSHADVLYALQETGDDVDWFYVSPAAGFGSYAPGEATGSYRVGGDVLVTDADGKSFISGADFALAFVDEIEQGRHRRQRFTIGY